MLTISGLAKSADVGVETIRFYQRKGLLGVPDAGSSSSAGKVRRYDADDVRRLHFIRRAQTAGFTLEEIARLLALDSTDDRAEAHALATARLEALDEQIARLTRARVALVSLTGACEAGKTGPCPIIEAFEAA
jgi:MerR family mercuric resistance operon transcriptional regulator